MHTLHTGGWESAGYAQIHLHKLTIHLYTYLA